IGDPSTRYREDPVRMLRAARLSAKLDFSIEEKTLEPIYHLAYLLKSVSAHRLYDESLKLFSCGHLQNLLSILHQLNLFYALFPLLEERVVNSELVQLAAKNTDDRLQQGKSINPAFFYAVLLWDWQQKLTAQQLASGEDLFPAQQNAAIEALNLQSKSTAIPRFVGQTIRDIWELQPRLAFPKARLVPKLISQPRFRAGFDFLWLREQTGDSGTNDMAAWWEAYQQATSDEQEKLLKALDKQRAKTIAKEKADKAEANAQKPKKRKAKTTKVAVNSGENA
ncbi:MAG TPA: polynucleotide adenylyltransferase PcnB, partial [Agitococcus sp.]|nr:polynucleotide adenylyltransferase PcnB [Agitococcus sp.]